MVDRILTVLGTAMMVAMVSGPGMAGISSCIEFPAQCQPTTVPEPATMTLFAAGAAGAFLVRKLIRRK